MAEKELECELWCQRCKLHYAQIFRVQVRDGMWEHRKEPAVTPKNCTACNEVIVRRT